MPDWEYRKYFKFIGGTPGKGAGSLWRCSFCGKKVWASWGIAAKHYWRHKAKEKVKGYCKILAKDKKALKEITKEYFKKR